MSLDRKDGLLAAGLGVFSLALYVRTLLPGLLPLDSAEFQTLAYTLDHAHTTGYHVYTVLAKLFTLVAPVEDIAYQVNLFSAVMGACTVALVYLVGRALSGSRWGGVIAALALAVSATFWSQAIIAEVYTLGSAFAAAIVLLAVLWYQEGKPWFLFAAGALGGMGIGAHGSVVLLAPAVLFLALLRWKAGRRVFLPAVGGVAAGVLLLVAAFAVVNSRTTHASVLWTAYIPSISRWDMTADQLDKFSGRFAFLVFARQWRPAMFVDPENVAPQNMEKLREAVQQDFPLAVQAMTVIGLAALLVRRWQLGLFLLIAIGFHLYYTLNYRIHDIYVFFIPLYVYSMALAANGAGSLLHWLKRLPGRWAGIAQGVVGLALLAAAVLPSAPARIDMLRQQEARWDFMQLPSNRELLGWRYWIRFTVERLPDDAIVLMDWYNLYGFTYTAQVEENRPGLLFIETYPYAEKPGIAVSLLEFLREQLASGRPVYTLYRVDDLQAGGMRLSPVNVGGTDLYLVELR